MGLRWQRKGWLSKTQYWLGKEDIRLTGGLGKRMLFLEDLKDGNMKKNVQLIQVMVFQRETALFFYDLAYCLSTGMALLVVTRRGVLGADISTIDPCRAAQSCFRASGYITYHVKLVR